MTELHVKDHMEIGHGPWEVANDVDTNMAQRLDASCSSQHSISYGRDEVA